MRETSVEPPPVKNKKITIPALEVTYPIKDKPYRASFIGTQANVSHQKDYISSRLNIFNQTKSTLGSQIDEKMLSNQIYSQIHKVYTNRSKPLC